MRIATLDLDLEGMAGNTTATTVTGINFDGCSSSVMVLIAVTIATTLLTAMETMIVS